MNLFLVSLLLTLTDFTHCSVVRIVYVEQVKPSWIYQSDKKKTNVGDLQAYWEETLLTLILRLIKYL